MNIDLPRGRFKEVLGDLLEAGLQAADPTLAIKRTVKVRRESLWVGTRRYDLRKYGRIVAVGAGKASVRMGLALENVLGNRLKGGLIVVKDGHGCKTKTLEIHEAGHPIPDPRGRRAAKAVLGQVQRLTPQDLVFVLISGGASSLLPVPAEGLSLADKQKTTNLLLRSGATIQEMNTVRKHLSEIKGGQLASATSATVVTLMLSDVLGDDPSAIGSGPTAPDPTTFQDATQILRRYHLWDRLPGSVRTRMKRGIGGAVKETPKPGERLFARVQNEIIGSNGLIIARVAKAVRKLGYHTLVLTSTLIGEAKEAAKTLGTIGREIHQYGRPICRPACIIMGGEPTVTVTGKGKGGRAQEFALSAAMVIAGLPNLWVAAMGTDGSDGPTDVAGAVVNGETLQKAEKLGLDPTKALANNDSHRFFQRAGGHIITGPTGTNVNDLYILLAP